MGEGIRPFILTDGKGTYLKYLKGEVVLYKHRLYEVIRDVFARVPTDSDYFLPLTFEDFIQSFNGLTGSIQGVSSFNGSTGSIEFVNYVSSWNGKTGAVKYTSHEYTGVLYGGVLSGVVGGTTFDVSAGIGQIVGYTASTSGVTAEVTEVTWGDFTGITLTNLATSDFTRLYIDSSGSLIQQTAPFNHVDYNDKIIIGTVSHIDRSTIALITNKQFTSYRIPHKVLELYDTFGPIKKNGLVVSANGTNLSLNRSSGEALVIGGDYPVDQFEPDDVEITEQNPASIARLYRDGSGDFIYDTNSFSFYTVVDPSKYDDNSGTLQAVNNNQYTVQRMFMFPNLQNVIMLYYGRVIYNSYSDALAGVQDEIFTEADITANNAVFLGYLIVRGGAADLSTTSDAKIIQSGFCRTVGSGGGGGGGTSVYYAGAGLTLDAGGETFSIDPTAVIEVSGISSDGDISLTDDIRIYNGSNYSRLNTNPSGSLSIRINGETNTTATFSATSVSIPSNRTLDVDGPADFAQRIKTSAGISMDTAGITFPDGTYQDTAVTNYVSSFNGVTGAVEGVSFVNGLTGGVTLNAGTNITLTSGPSGITIDSAGGGGGGGETYSVAFVIDGNGSPITLGHKVDALRQIPVDSTLTKSEIYSQDGAVAGSGNFTVNLAWVDDLEQSLSGVTGSATTINLSGVSDNLSLTPPKTGTNYYHNGTPTTPPSVTGGNWVYPIVTINASSQTKIQLFMSFIPS